MTGDQSGTTDHIARHGRSHIYNGCAVQACSQGPPATKDHFLWPQGVVVVVYTLFIVEIKTGKMPNNIGPTVNNML